MTKSEIIDLELENPKEMTIAEITMKSVISNMNKQKKYN